MKRWILKVKLNISVSIKDSKSWNARAHCEDVSRANRRPLDDKNEKILENSHESDWNMKPDTFFPETLRMTSLTIDY